MPNSQKKVLVFIALACLAATAAVMWGMGGVNIDKMQILLERAGFWAPIIYIAIYAFATILVLPSTALNLAGGALFGPWIGTLWTSVGAIIAAIIAFSFTRTIGRTLVEKRLGSSWRTLDDEIRLGGRFYMFSMRLLPIIPYGLVNFAAGLTSIRFRDYVIGTALGTPPGALPFVMLGSSGMKTLQTGDVLPLVGALTLIGLLVGGATWYRRSRRSPQRKS
ncbi:MAG: TVP38/TMEM64 family protein [Leptolyngbyaceae cyanobacterium MO_188.B28]|nr:TVP38/TMEM64 family protein [Leptolyngbyaceae cyanobacterium MO_188.B28]